MSARWEQWARARARPPVRRRRRPAERRARGGAADRAEAARRLRRRRAGAVRDRQRARLSLGHPAPALPERRGDRRWFAGLDRQRPACSWPSSMARSSAMAACTAARAGDTMSAVLGLGVRDAFQAPRHRHCPARGADRHGRQLARHAPAGAHGVHRQCGRHRALRALRLRPRGPTGAYAYRGGRYVDALAMARLRGLP